MSALDYSAEDTAGNGNPGNGEITAAEGEAYRRLVIGLPASLPTLAGPKGRLLACLGQCRGFGLGPWACGKIYKISPGGRRSWPWPPARY